MEVDLTSLPVALVELATILKVDGDKASRFARKQAGELGKAIDCLRTRTEFPNGMPRDVQARPAARAECRQELIHILNEAARFCGSLYLPKAPPDHQRLLAIVDRLQEMVGSDKPVGGRRRGRRPGTTSSTAKRPGIETEIKSGGFNESIAKHFKVSTDYVQRIRTRLNSENGPNES